MGINIPNMGRKVKTRTAVIPKQTSLASALFSATQQRVLGFLFGQPERSFFATELIGLIGAGSGAVQRELARLADSGLVTVTRVGNQKHYQANPHTPIYNELHGLVLKTCGLADVLQRALQPLADKIEKAFVYGSVAKREDSATSDIDLMIISESLTHADLFMVLEEANMTLGRTVNPTIYTPQEWTARIKQDNAFVTRVIEQAKLWLLGEDYDITT